MLFMRKTCVDSRRRRWGKKKKKTSAHLNSNTFGYCFCNQKTSFFSSSSSFAPRPPQASLLHSLPPSLPCIYNTYRTRLLKLRGQSRFIIVMQKKWKRETPRRGSRSLAERGSREGRGKKKTRGREGKKDSGRSSWGEGEGGRKKRLRPLM